MTDHAEKQGQRRRTLRSGIRRKKQIILLSLILILGSGAFLFHKDKFYAISEILSWLRQNKPASALASSPSPLPRGDIYDRNFRRLAATYETFAIYARPLEMEDPAASAHMLEEILGLEKNRLIANFKSERGFVWIAKNIDQSLADKVKERNIKGLYQVVETKRFYPNYQTAAHAVGFVENDQGLDGMEFQYNTLLRGGEISRTELEALHFSSAQEFKESGTHLVLNIDLMIQSKIERFLEKRVKITGAESGAVLLMNANTGGIIAMASFPAFNPNNYWDFSSSALNNNAVTEPVYPGELSLIFQQAAAINLKHERREQAFTSLREAETHPVITPEKRKRRKLSVAPPVDTVDPEYFVQFAKMLGFGQKPLTDIPLKDEAPVFSSFALTDPSFHTSALRLLTGFTALVNKGRIVSPHLLYRAFPKENPTPVETTLPVLEKTVSLHPATNKSLIDFLAAKWLKFKHKGRASQAPMFFEAHRYAAVPEETELDEGENTAATLNGHTPRITQSTMLGAIPGRDPKLTMLALLSYPDSYDEGYTGMLEAFGDKLSILSPDQELIKKMLYVAERDPLVPSPDFWANAGNASSSDINLRSPEKKEFTGMVEDKKNMPDVTGKSLRAGLQVLQHFNLEVKLVGSGRIVSQEPAAGSRLKDGTVCILEMQQEI